MIQKENKTKRKLKLRNFFLFCFVFFLLLFFCFWLYFLPMKSILITGTTYLSDYEIIMAAEIKDYPSLFHVRSKDLKSKIRALDFVRDVKIHKNLFGRLWIEVTEEVPVFYYRNRNVLTFLSGKEVVTTELQGLPIVVNYVPDSIYGRLLKEMQEMNTDVLMLISEIEYQPWKSEDVVIDDTRFFLRMNDGNEVYVNLINWDKLNNYMTIYSTIDSAKGTLQLDSSLGNGITFTPFEEGS